MNNKGGPGDNWWGCKKRTIKVGQEKISWFFSGRTGGLDRDKNDLQDEKISLQCK